MSPARRDRHLFDAAALLACVDAPFEEFEHLGGSDRRRIGTPAARLTDDHPAWRALPGTARTQGRLTLRILAAS